MQLDRRDLHRWLLGLGAATALGAPSGLLARAAGKGDPLHLVDPELRAAAQAMLGQSFPPLTRAGLPALRAAWVAPPPLPAPAPPAEIRSVRGPKGAPDVSVELIGVRARPARCPAILHIHGGGMISGRARNMTAFCQTIAAEFDCVVVNVDYRLSPETRFPGPVEDNYAVFAWLVENAAELGVDPSRIAVLGGSAGGGLAAMVTMLARDRGGVQPCQQILLYPMLDDRTGSTRKPAPHLAPVGWSAEANAFGWSAFLGVPAGSAKVPAGAVPARAPNLSGLPPSFIGVGALDLFVDEDLDFGRRLIEAGVPTALHVSPGAFHAFDFVVPDAAVSKAFTQAWKAALRTAFAKVA
ncbi:alpha/beta hydrolase [Sphingomonas sp. WG]|nr:alpha/beta hydrolase [Sphingomonas sp. WG]